MNGGIGIGIMTKPYSLQKMNIVNPTKHDLLERREECPAGITNL